MYPEDQGILAQPKKPGPISRALAASGIAAPMPIQADQRVAFAGGGSIADGGITRQETAEELMARMTAKYGVPAAGPVQQPALQPVQQTAQQPAPPASQGGILGGAIEAMKNRKKQIEEAAGFANGGKISGPGTSTSDSIPAVVRETGEGIRVSNRERIVSADQEKALQHLAQTQGFESVDSMLEQMTGKPVGPTIKSTKRAAEDGLSPETDPDSDNRRQYSPGYGDAFANRGGSFAPQGPSNGPDSILATPTIHGITTRSASAPDSLQSMTAPQGSMAVAKPEVREASGEHAPSSNQGITGIAALPAGRNEQGVITAESAPSVTGNPMTRSGGITGSIDMAGVNGILARENQARGEMIDSSIRANGGNGIGILGDGGIEAANAEKTQRWRQDELLAKASGGNRAAGDAIQANARLAGDQIQSATMQRAQDVGAGTTARTQEMKGQLAQDRNQLVARGQDLTAGTAADRIASSEAIAERRGTGNLTLPQRRSNFEITAARKAVAGLTPDEIKHKTANYTATGRENPDYDPALAKAVSLAGRRMYGDDAEFDQRQQKEPAQQPAGNDGDVTTRFRADAGMKGHTMGKQTDMGMEVLDASGKVIGHYK